MPVAITVLYPKTSDSSFNLDYYLSSHMPFVLKKFGYASWLPFALQISPTTT